VILDTQKLSNGDILWQVSWYFLFKWWRLGFFLRLIDGGGTVEVFLVLSITYRFSDSPKTTSKTTPVALRSLHQSACE